VRPDRRADRVPALLWIPAGVALAFLVLPLAALVVRAPWATLGERLADPGIARALGLSLCSALTATALSLALGVPLAFVLARSAGRPPVVQRILRASFRVPLMPWLPILSAVLCVWLMLNLTTLTWVRFLVWLALGFAVYFLYGRRHSLVGQEEARIAAGGAPAPELPSAATPRD